MTSTTYSNSKVDGVLITRKRVNELIAIMHGAAYQGVPEGASLSLYKISIKLTRAHNELEFDTLEEMDSVLADFPEWRHPASMDLGITAYNHGYLAPLSGQRNSSRLDFARTMSLRFKANNACHVYASGDTTRWGLTTGSLMESQLRKYRTWRRWSRSLLVLAIVVAAALVSPAVIHTVWFLPPALLTLSFTLLVMSGMPLGRWFYKNKISLGK